MPEKVKHVDLETTNKESEQNNSLGATVNCPFTGYHIYVQL